MFSFIALPVVLAVGIAGFAHVRNVRGGREPWHFLRSLGPVSSDWLADYRRIG